MSDGLRAKLPLRLCFLTEIISALTHNASQRDAHTVPPNGRLSFPGRRLAYYIIFTLNIYLSPSVRSSSILLDSRQVISNQYDSPSINPGNNIRLHSVGIQSHSMRN